MGRNPRYSTPFAYQLFWAVSDVNGKARFGASLLVADMNGDGIADVAVSSPFSHGRDQKSPLAGKVEVFFLDSSQ